MVVIPKELLAKLYEVYRYYWYDFSTTEANWTDIAMGFSSMVTIKDDNAMELLCLPLEDREAEIRSILGDETSGA